MKMGGMERAGVNLANALNNEKLNISFISFFKQEHFFKLDKNITLYEPPNFNVHKLSLIRSILWLRKTIKEINPDKIIVLNKLYGAITCFSLIGYRYQVFLSERSSPLYKWPLSQSIMIKLIFTIIKPYGVIAQTKIASEYQKKYYGDKIKIKVIPNAVRNVQFYPGIRREKVVLAAGRLNDSLKGFDRLLFAFSMIKNQEWKLHIAGGNSNEDPLLEEIINENNLHDRVIFLGKITDLDLTFASASIFVIPSRSEGFPNVLCEAMAAGLPCISFDFVAGPSDIIENRIDGILIEDGNIIELSKQLEALMNDESERIRLGKNARKIKEKLSGTAISKILISFLKDE